MAHYAELGGEINTGGIVGREVLSVVVVSNDYETQDADPEVQEVGGLAWLASFGPTSGKEFKKTSYNSSFRKNFAGVGFVWDSVRGAFIPPQPDPSWVLNEETCRWEAP